MKRLFQCLVAWFCIMALPFTAHAQDTETQVVDLGDGYVITVPVDWQVKRIDSGAFTMSDPSLTLTVATPARLEIANLQFDPSADITDILISLALPFNGVQLTPESIQRVSIDNRQAALYINADNKIVDQVYAVVAMSDGKYGYLTLTSIKGMLQEQQYMIQEVFTSFNTGSALPPTSENQNLSMTLPTETAISLPTIPASASGETSTAAPTGTAAIPDATNTTLPPTATPLFPTITPTATETLTPSVTPTPAPTETPLPPTELPTETESPQSCTVSIDQRDTAQLRVGPGVNRGIITYLLPNIEVSVTGRVELSDGSVWYQLDKAQAAPNGTEARELWVAAANVTVQGDCENIGAAATPPIVRRATATPEGGEATAEAQPEATASVEPTSSATSLAPTLPPAETGSAGTEPRLPINGTWTLIMDSVANSSCRGRQNVERASSDFFSSATVSAFLRIIDGDSFSYGSDLYTRAPDTDTFFGEFSLADNPNAQAWLTVNSATSIFGQVTTNFTEDSTPCSATVLVIMNRD